MRFVLALTAILAAGPGPAAGERIRFWNLTAHTIKDLRLAPAGTNKFGPNQCANDPDGTVDHDERLRITGVTPGSYDAKFQDSSGRTCIVRNMAIGEGDIFSIEEQDLHECRR